MAGRPEILFPLFAGLETLPGIGARSAERLKALEITTPRDLLFTLPHSGIDRSHRSSIREVAPPAVATVEVTVLRHYRPTGKGPHRVLVRDGGGVEFELVFFHGHGARLQHLLPVGQRRLVSGRLELFDGVAQMAHPDHILPPEDAGDLPTFEPVYPLTEGVTQRAMRRAAAAARARAPELAEWIDPALLLREGWPGWRAALEAAHAPQEQAALARDAPARRRLAYDELFAHQLAMALARAAQRRRPGRAVRGDGALRRRVRDALGFELTRAQERTIAEIAEDMAAETRMSRLLQGDVGAGKTLVALMALLIAVEAGGQGALMAPTGILAQQHHDSLAPLADAAGVRLGLLTGEDTGAVRAAKLAALASGETQILVGTHSLFQRDVTFADLRLAIIDEQHRFGVAQRMELGAKGAAADVLVMTATPIPRSLALAQYGDMDVSQLDEKPPGRRPIRTALVSVARLEEVVAHLRDALGAGRQAYWVCPLVEDSESVELTSVEARFRQLRAALGEGVVDLVHGRMPAAQKEAAMARFDAGETGVLVATTVIEVGVNVPNATIMVVERAESFGLAQLHQLRGRVGRGTADSTCLLLHAPPLSEPARRRLQIMRESEDGFRIAEEDLAIRGAGDLMGTAQSGLPRFRIADLERQAGLMALAQSDARALLGSDPELYGERGDAARVLLWLMERDKAIRLLRVG